MKPLCCPTTGLEKILLSTDGSALGKGAVAGSISLARTCSSKLYALDVIEANPEYEAIAPNLVEMAEKEAKKHLEDVKSAALKENVQCETMARHGEEPYKVIVDEAEKAKADMIVMGRRGRTGLSRLIMGSVTAKVIGHSGCNVLVVPAAAELDWKNIVAATDGSKQGNNAVLEAITIAKRCGSVLTIISSLASDELITMEDSRLIFKDVAEQVTAATQKNVTDLEEVARKEGVQAEGLVLSGNAAEAVIKFAKKKKADLIVVGSHGRTGLERLLMGSVAERIIVLSSSPVLVIKAK